MMNQTMFLWNEFKFWIIDLHQKRVLVIRSEQAKLIKADAKSNLRMFRTFHKLRQIPPNAINAHLQRTECLWKLNMTCPKTSNIIKINSFIKKTKKVN